VLSFSRCLIGNFEALGTPKAYAFSGFFAGENEFYVSNILEVFLDQRQYASPAHRSFVEYPFRCAQSFCDRRRTMPLRMRRSSSRSGPVSPVGRCGSIRAHCLSGDAFDTYVRAYRSPGAVRGALADYRACGGEFNRSLQHIVRTSQPASERARSFSAFH
jgi:hypothetical protein